MITLFENTQTSEPYEENMLNNLLDDHISTVDPFFTPYSIEIGDIDS